MLSVLSVCLKGQKKEEKRKIKKVNNLPFPSRRAQSQEVTVIVCAVQSSLSCYFVPPFLFLSSVTFFSFTLHSLSQLPGVQDTTTLDITSTSTSFTHSNTHPNNCTLTHSLSTETTATTHSKEYSLHFTAHNRYMQINLEQLNSGSGRR